MKTKTIWLAALALLAILFISGTVFAEGEEPPAVPDESANAIEAPPPPKVKETPVEPVTVVEETPPPAEPEVPELELLVVEQEPAAEEAPVVEEPVTNALAPDSVDTDLVLEEPLPVSEELPILVEEPILVDAEGEPLVLASEEAAELLIAPDPYFYIGGVPYQFTTADCNPGIAGNQPCSNPLLAAINYIDVNALVPDGGFLYVEKATYTGNVVIDYTAKPNLSSLTGLVGLPTLGLYPTISGTLTLGNLNNGFSLVGFNVTGGTLIHDSQGQFIIEKVSGTLTFDDTNSTGFTGNGIHIKDHKGNIVLNNAIARNNTEKGVYIENQISGNVTIYNSAYYENNGSHGLKIESKGIVSIDDTHANYNNIGIVVETCSALTIKNTEANNNRTAGILAEPVGKPVTLENVTANTNGDVYDLDGIHLLNVGTVNAKNITVNSNFNDGFHIESTGIVTLNNVTANDNYNTGIAIKSPSTITLNSVMANGNNSLGIEINYNPSGSVVNMNGVVANNNSMGIFVLSKGATLKNIATLENNGNGLMVAIMGGTTLLENMVANNNVSVGIFIVANPGLTSALTLKNITASNNKYGGVRTETLGAVTINNSSTNGNTNGDGINIETNGAVTITGLGAFENGKNGLFVRTKGAITITGIFAGSNGFSGADLDNGLCTYNNVKEIWTCLGTGAIQVKNTSDHLNDLSSNDHFGLWAVSKGTITITNLRATDNDSDGAYLTNRFGGSTAGITVNTLGAVRNEFSNNGWFEVFHPADDDIYQVLANGLSALSAGNISVTNTDAWQNHGGGGGIYLDSKFSTAARTVTLTNSNAGDNDWVGVWIWSRGNIAVTNVSANDNRSEGGIHVDNCLDRFYGSEDNTCSSTGTVSLTNVNAHNNGGTGIEAFSKGTITLNGANSSNNWEMGINLVNNFSGATAGITLTNIDASGNNNTGLSATTNGSATLTTINTHNNAKTSGYIETGQTVQDFSNGNYGPDMWWFNGEPGQTYNFRLEANAMDLNRTDFDPWIELYDGENPDTPLGVTITCEENNYCAFSFSPGDAPFYYTEAAKFYVRVGSESGYGFYRLALNNPVIEDNNHPYWVNGTGISAGGSITVRGIDTSNNSLTGLGATVMGNGKITLSNLQVHNNGTEGVYLTCGQLPDWSDSGFGTGSISLSGSNDISDNGWDGLMMATSGTVTLSSLEASRNGQPTNSPGISIRKGHAAKTVTLSGVNAGENGQWGLWFIATGNISLTKVNAWQNNNEGGIYLDNCLDFDPATEEEDGVCYGTGTIKLTTVYSSDNNGKGIEIYSKGLITLSGVQAYNNKQAGIRVFNNFNLTTAGITLGNVRADGNGQNGIVAWTNGALALSNINANSNAMTWGSADNGHTVQNYFNEYKGPDHWWFEATEGVPITLTLWADGSNGSEWLNRWDFDPFLRIFDENETEITANQSITSDYTSGASYTDFYQIEWTPGSGESGWFYLEVSSDNASSGFYRLSVDDSDPANPDMFWVDGLTYFVGGNVTMSGTNNFSDNEQAGLIGWSKGNVTLANIVTWGNGCEGIYLDNTDGSGNILINGTNTASENGREGLRIMTDGTVTISNLEANHNSQDGIWIVANTALKAVTLNNIVAMWNGINGLNLTTHGITTLNNVRAWFNTEDGANIDTNRYRLSVLNSSFICNDDDGFFYVWYVNTPPMLPFVFTNTNNIFLGNGGSDLVAIY